MSIKHEKKLENTARPMQSELLSVPKPVSEKWL